MYNEYIKELFTEGLGDIFFMKYYYFLQTKIKNSFLRKILIIIHGVCYLTFLFFIAFIIFKLSFPL